MVFLSDIEGVYKDKDDPDTLISELHVHEAEKLISEGYVGGRNDSEAAELYRRDRRGRKQKYIFWTDVFHTVSFWRSLQTKVSDTAILREDGEKYYNEHE